MTSWIGRFLVALAMITTAMGGVAFAESVQDYYRGKTITLVASTGSGGGYDVYARPIVRHLGKHIPGEPNVILQHMPGAGGLRAMNYLYSTAPKDGTVIGLLQAFLPFAPIFGLSAAQFDSSKFNWIGTLNSVGTLCVVWHGAPVKTFDDLMTHQITVGSTGAASPMGIFPMMMNRLFGTKFRVIPGYKDGTSIFLAMERGELDGRCNVPMFNLRAVKPDWLEGNKVRILVQTGLVADKDPLLKDVPLIYDLAKNDEQRKVMDVLFASQEVDKLIVAPPGVPPERVAALRAALEQMASDPAFLADMGKSPIVYGSGQEVEQLVKRVFAVPPSVTKMLREITAGGAPG